MITLNAVILVQKLGGNFMTITKNTNYNFVVIRNEECVQIWFKNGEVIAPVTELKK